MAVIETWFEQDLQKPVKVRYIDGNLFSHNGNGNRIGVVITNNGEPVTLTGTVSGYAVLADGTTVPCTGTRSGNKASILVPAAAYSPGSILISIFLTDGTTVTTLAALSSSVIMARTGNQIDPGSVVTDWTNTINAAMQSVETAAANLGNIIATPYENLPFPVPLGKYTIYNNGLYRCISPIASSEEWTAAHWTNVKLGDDVADLKSAFVQLNNDLKSLVIPGDYANGSVLFTNETVPAGTVIRYMLSADEGTAAFLDVRSLTDSRITYIGKGASSSGALVYEGTYTLPSNYKQIVVGTTSNANLHIVYLSTGIDRVIDAEIEKAVLSVENLDNAIYISRTGNQLDTNYSIKGIGIDRINKVFTYGLTYTLSKILPFGDATSIMVSAVSGNPVIATLTSPMLEDRFINNTFLVSGSRIINKEIGVDYVVCDLTGCTGVKIAYGYNNETPTETTDEFSKSPEAMFLSGVANEINDRKQLQAIYGSSSANWLDLKNKVWGYKINSDNTFSRDMNSAISKFVYVGDITYDNSHSIMVSGYSTGGVLRLALLTDAKIDSNCITNTFLLTNTSRNIPLAKGTKYVVLTLVVNGIDYSKGLVLRKDTSTTAVAFNPMFLGWPGHENEFQTNIKYYHQDIRQLETLLLYRRWLPLAYGRQDSYLQSAPVVHRVNLMFHSDVHIDYGNAYESRQNVDDIAFIANNTPLKFDAVVCGGDIMTRPNVKAKKIAEMEKYYFDIVKGIDTIPVLWAVGNHDCNDMFHSPESGYTPNVEDVFTPADYNNMWFDYAESRYGIVRQLRSNGYKSTYSYYDISAKKTRIICVDVNDVDKSILEDDHVKYNGSVGFYISQEQMDWIINTALNVNANENWTIVFVMHQAQRIIGQDPENPEFYAPDGIPSAIEKLLLVCQAFTNGTTYSSTYTNSESSFNLNINVDYTSLANKTVRPRIACWLIGHEHTDHYAKLHDINIIHILHSLAYDYADGDKNIAKTLGSFNQGAFDVVNIDPVERKIRTFRYGCGVDCYNNGGDRFMPDGIDF